MVKVSVVGSGLLGLKIAGELSLQGHSVRVFDSDPKSLNNLHHRLKQDREELVSDGILSSTNVIGQVFCFSRLEDACRGVEVIFEAVTEDLDIKRDLLEKISKCNETAIIATSSLRLDVSEVFSRANAKERTIGVRFLFPVYYIPEVEARPNGYTSPLTVEKVRVFLERMGKTMFLRSGFEPLVLTEEQRDERKQAYKLEMDQHKGLGGRWRYGVPQLAHKGNFPILEHLTASVRSRSMQECSVCMEKSRDCIFLPCHHMCSCLSCGELLSGRDDGCPICRTAIREVMRVFHS